MQQYDYIYLHGFASSHLSSKAQVFKARLEDHGCKVTVPDMNLDDFANLTLSRQLEQVSAIVISAAKPVVMFGSSMGGLTAALLAEKHKNIVRLILMAPAFRMSKLWESGPVSDLKHWQENGQTLIMHYGYNREMPLKHSFYTDLFKHDDINFQRQLPALIFHGIHDDVVPPEYSREYAKSHPLCKLEELDDDHSLGKSVDLMWDMTYTFCNS